MNDAIVHRGPDHRAVETHGRCVLGYRRLSVVDLQTGDQPVANERSDVVAVFNGEIYNFPYWSPKASSVRTALAGSGTPSE